MITLPTKELRSGFAEVIKHALIADGPYWFKIRSSSLDEQPWHEHIAHSVYTKHQIVTADPNENSIRKSLNFGHTVGHAIERHYLHEPDPLLHGEAIAIGMICEAYISTRKEGLATTHLNEISSYLLQIFGKVRIPDGELNAIAKNALQDKKNQDGHIVCTLLPDIGEVTYETTITLPEIEESLQFYGSLDASP